MLPITAPKMTPTHAMARSLLFVDRCKTTTPVAIEMICSGTQAKNNIEQTPVIRDCMAREWVLQRGSLAVAS